MRCPASAASQESAASGTTLTHILEEGLHAVLDEEPPTEPYGAQIVALRLEHGATTVLTIDARFRQFPGAIVKKPA